jgi:hypothetical protein
MKQLMSGAALLALAGLGIGGAFAWAAPRAEATVSAEAAEGMIAGGTDVPEAGKRVRLASFLAPSLERETDAIEASMRRLQERAGQGMYLEIRQAGAARPAVVLESAPGAVASLHVNGRMDVDLSESDGRDGTMAVFWVQAGRLGEYHATVPGSVTHVTVVINGREAVAARPFDHAAGRVVIR